MQIAQSIKENITILHCASMLGYHPVQRRGQRLSWTLKEHDSLVINLDERGRQRFIWNSRRVYGSVIDFYMAMTGCTQDKAILELGNVLKQHSISSWDSVRKSEIGSYHPVQQTSEIQLPEKSSDGSKRAFAYLCKTRSLDAKLVGELFKTHTLYQDKRGNVVFCGKNPQTKKIEYASVRGTLSDKQYRGDVSGSRKEIGFHFRLYHENPPAKLFVCESPIDCMSVASLLLAYDRPLEPYGFLSLGGTATNALEYHIRQNPQIDTIYLCQDNDDAGNHSRLQARTKLEELGFTGKIIDKLPLRKDFNEDLQKMTQLTTVAKLQEKSYSVQQIREPEQQY